jgi:adenosylmethionine-8-amino-7-oxononanoate aminotransferase
MCTGIARKQSTRIILLGKVAHSTLSAGSRPIHRAGEKARGNNPEGLNRVFYSDSGPLRLVALKIAFQYWRNLGFEKKDCLPLCLRHITETPSALELRHRLFHTIFHPLLFQTLTIPSFPCTQPGSAPKNAQQIIHHFAR